MHDILIRLGLDKNPRVIANPTGHETPEKDGVVVSFNPATGKPLAAVRLDTAEDLERVTARAAAAFDRWRRVPAPKRGEVVRRIGNAYRDVLEDLGSLIAVEMGKIKAEGVGEVLSADELITAYPDLKHL
jgi:aldehyde dehydrogenase (NAD+)